MTLKEKIYIVVATDNYYAILLAALLKSLEENHHTKEHLEVYIIDDGISSKNKKRLQLQVNHDKITLHWCKGNQVVPPDVKIPLDSSSFPLTSYMRLFGPHIVPEEAEKIIYLDVDMIVQADISLLWHTDLQGHIFGAVRDLAETVSCSWSGIPNYKELGIPADTSYFNAGMMLINAPQWRKEDIANKVMQTIHDNLEHVNLVDQYGLNIVLANRWLEMDRRWNSFAANAVSDPYILHFLDIKPIFKSYNSSPAYKTIFYKYLKLTAWKSHTPVSKYKRLARKAYNKIKKRAMNLFNQ
jgi:lipopolysaccharide biosynthesis glycosyltransferase